MQLYGNESLLATVESGKRSLFNSLNFKYQTSERIKSKTDLEKNN